MIPAHDNPLAALAFNSLGNKLATASEKVRPFSRSILSYRDMLFTENLKSYQTVQNSNVLSPYFEHCCVIASSTGIIF